MLIDHDVHIHTTLSACCRDPDATPLNILVRARAEGLRTVGLADHMWGSDCPGASPWYVSQGVERIDSMRAALPCDAEGMRVLVGCESEFCGDNKVGISPATAERLDYVLLPMSHFHMRGFVAPAELTDPADVGALMVKRFMAVLGTGLADGIAHPFLPCGHYENADRIIASIDDATFAACFDAAADAGVSIEITLCFFPGCGGDETDGFHDETFLRVLAIAKQEGCTFHFASDTHSLAGVGAVRHLEPYVQELGLTSAHIAPWVHGD